MLISRNQQHRLRDVMENRREFATVTLEYAKNTAFPFDFVCNEDTIMLCYGVHQQSIVFEEGKVLYRAVRSLP